MNNDWYQNQNNNPTNNEPPTFPGTENAKDQQTSMKPSVAMGPSFDKNKAFKYAVFYVIISVIAIFAGVYIFVQGLSNRGNNFGNYIAFLVAELLAIGVIYRSLLLAESMIVQYKKGRYHFISQAVKNSSKAALYAAIVVVVFLTLLLTHDRPITVFTFLLSPIAAFASALEITNEESVRRYAINMSITDGKIEKKHALLYTIIYIILCLLVLMFFAIVLFDSRDALHAGLVSLVEAIFPIAAIITVIFICISIYWYKSGRYWIADYLVKNGKVVNLFFTTMIFYAITPFLYMSADMEDKYSIIWLPISLTFLVLKLVVLVSPLVTLAYVSWITVSCYVGSHRTKPIEESVEKRQPDYTEYYTNQPLSYKWIKPMIIAIIAIIVLLAILIPLLIAIG
jgi:membrane protein